MKTIAFDYKTGIKVNSNNRLFLDEGADALVSKIKQRLRLLKGEWFLNTTLGVPYRSEIAKPPINPALIANIISNEVLKESDVIGIRDISITYSSLTRQYEYDFFVDTIYDQSFNISSVN